MYSAVPATTLNMEFLFHRYVRHTTAIESISGIACCHKAYKKGFLLKENTRGFPLVRLRFFLYNDFSFKYGFESLSVWALAVALYALRKHLVIDPSEVVSDLLRR